MRRSTYLGAGVGVFVILMLCASTIGQQPPPPPPFPFCTDTPEYCQKKVAQVPFPFQFWAMENGNVIDRIRISETWLNPPGNEPPGVGEVRVRRQVATSDVAFPLPELVWDFAGDMPRPPVAWRPIDPPEGTVLTADQDLEAEIPVSETDQAALVAYQILLDGEVVAHSINQAVLESQSPQAIVQIMVNFDLHNTTPFPVTNLELDFLGLDFGCESVLDAMGFVAGIGIPPAPLPGEPWGANPDHPLVVRPIPGGTEVKWIQPDRPLVLCEWVHGGLVLDCTGFDCFNNPADPELRASVQAYWTVAEPKVCDPRTQGYWRRICAGALGQKKLHPETPAAFDPSLCRALMVKGKARSNPCIRARAQLAALQMNIQYGYLSDCCEIVDPAGNVLSVEQAARRVMRLINAGRCKEAADLAESINSGDALIGDP